MPIALDSIRTIYPAIKFQQEGEYVEVAVVRVETIPLLKFGTEIQETTADGKPREQTRLTGLVIGGSASIKKDEPQAGGPVMVAPPIGELVSLYLKGMSRWEFFQAKKTLEPKGFEVGDVLRWTYTGTIPGKNPGTTKKTYTVTLSKSATRDAGRTEACEAHYTRLVAADAADTGEYDPTHDPNSPDCDQFGD